MRSMLVGTLPISLQLLQRVDVDPLILILQELDDLIEAEGGVLIPSDRQFVAERRGEGILSPCCQHASVC